MREVREMQEPKHIRYAREYESQLADVISGYEQQQVKSQLDPLISNGVSDGLTYFNSWWEEKINLFGTPIPFPWKMVELSLFFYLCNLSTA